MVLDNVLLTGASGNLGKKFKQYFLEKKVVLYTPSSREMDITDPKSISDFCKGKNINTIIHCAAYTDVKKANNTDDFLVCNRVNVGGTLNLIEEAHKNGAFLLFISTDAVFDGKKGDYKPKDYVNPLNKYARTKVSAEYLVMNYENSSIIRTSFFPQDFPYDSAFVDQITNKDYLDKIFEKIILTIETLESGRIYHVGTEKKTMFDLAIRTKKDVKESRLEDFSLLNIAPDLSFDGEIKDEKY